MFLRATVRKKDGKEHRYWRIGSILFRNFEIGCRGQLGQGGQDTSLANLLFPSIPQGQGPKPDCCLKSSGRSARATAARNHHRRRLPGPPLCSEDFQGVALEKSICYSLQTLPIGEVRLT